jgi:F-type H+-transporting ATPase subunit a
MTVLEPRIVFWVAGVPVSESVVTTWGLMAILLAFAGWYRLSATMRPGRLQNAFEWLLEAVQKLSSAMAGQEERRFVPLVLTQGLLIGLANLAPLVPGVRSPNEDLACTLALAIVVFFAVHYFGVRTWGPAGYVGRYFRPAYFAPIRLIEDFSRVISLSVRLFGNIMGEGVLVGILVLLAPLLVPVPMMLFGIFTGVLQAYIFCMLTLVYLAGATGAQAEEGGAP